MNPASVNVLVQAAAARAGLDPDAYSAHSLRAGFVTYAHLRGASERAIAHQTRHRSLATLSAVPTGGGRTSPARGLASAARNSLREMG